MVLDEQRFSVSVCQDASEWDRLVNQLGGHPLQLWGWGELKRKYGWGATRLIVSSGTGETVAVCQLLHKPLPGPLADYVYAPRGPVFLRDCVDAEQLAADPTPAAVADAIAEYVVKQQGAIAVAFEPDEEQGTLTLGQKWRQTAQAVLPPETLVLDLRNTPVQLLGEMSKKHRQYIRKSEREPGLTVRPVETLEELRRCLEIYRTTSERAGFDLRTDSYYEDVFTLLGDGAPVWASYYEDEPVAFLFMAKSRRVAFELYGGMNETGQRLRANYALKWHVIQWMREQGVTRYDFGGLVEGGVTTFKKGFAKHLNQLVGTFDYPGRGYLLWSKGLPLAKRVAKKLGR